jgi:exosortase
MRKAAGIVLGAALAAAILIAYLPTLKWMVNRFDGIDSYYGHGYLIPFVFAYLLYRQRKVWMPELERLTRGGVALSAVLFTVAIAMNCLGHRLTIFFLSGLSLPLAIMAVGAMLFNPSGLARLWFPFLFLYAMVPLPNELLEVISTPLKVFVSHAAVAAVDLLGVPVILNGFEVHLRWGPLIVGNPCSGLRSLVSLTALAALVAHMSPLRPGLRLAVFLLAIPIAIACNFARITFLLLTADSRGLASVEPGTLAHDGSGYVMFAIALLTLVTASRWAEHQWPSTAN